MSREASVPTGVRVVDARLHLLSRQVLDVDGEPVTTVDDLELVAADGADGTARDDGPRDAVPGEPAEVGALLTGPVLVTRLLGGRPPASRWRTRPTPTTPTPTTVR